MPDMARVDKNILRVLENVRSSYREQVVRVKVVNNVLFGIREPDLLEEDNFGLRVVEEE